MLDLELRIYPDPILRTPCAKVEKFDSALKKLLDQMYHKMQLENGIGLAAPQIGVSQQITVIDISREGDQRIELINPVIVSKAGKVPSDEGCLSIPGYRDSIQRAQKIKVRYRDRDGNEQEQEAEELLAICMQHEIDHLNGVLFIDHLSRLKRELFKKWLQKQGLEFSAP